MSNWECLDTVLGGLRKQWQRTDGMQMSAGPALDRISVVHALMMVMMMMLMMIKLQSHCWYYRVMAGMAVRLKVNSV